jgi:hypothetical protein
MGLSKSKANINIEVETNKAKCFGECPICLDDMFDYQQNDIVWLECTHLFHFKCINEWKIKSNKCPICEYPF